MIVHTIAKELWKEQRIFSLALVYRIKKEFYTKIVFKVHALIKMKISNRLKNVNNFIVYTCVV
jgi:hypothetical protein